MSLVRLGKFAPSQTPYALDQSTLRRDDSGFWLVDALWAGRKDGKTTISSGTLRHYRPQDEALPFGTFLTAIDMRYGGECEFKWDGSALWSAQHRPTSELLDEERRLGAAVKLFPLTPPSHDGWYYRAPRRN